MTCKVSDMSVLLESTNEAFYWTGFLLADGHFSRGNRVRVALSRKDEAHLMKFASFIGYTGSTGTDLHSVSVSAMDTSVIEELRKRYKVSPRKTYQPVHIPEMESDHLLSLVCGFVDGDGSVCKMVGRRDCIFRIKCHRNWLHVLKNFSIVMFDRDYAVINKCGYAEVSVVDHAALKNLKTRALRLNIPLMGRKWDTIDCSYINRTEVARHKEGVVRQLVSEGLSNVEIARHMSVSRSNITQIMRRIGLKNDNNRR